MATGLGRHPPAKVRQAKKGTKWYLCSSFHSKDCELERNKKKFLLLPQLPHLPLLLLLRVWQQGALPHYLVWLFGSWKNWGEKPPSLSWTGQTSICLSSCVHWSVFLKHLLNCWAHVLLLSFLTATLTSRPRCRCTKTASTASHRTCRIYTL